ncbi:TIGR01459 family HAD-type hydrolase [Terrarubrum flagellatum]|uniref:TIGR01459 family HAD-type hydrolase n=1 Tax=Terrirubrum flagellatum TaxID=2895980 RepID=UPI0031456DB8
MVLSVVPVASGLSSLVQDIDLLLVDVWGVLHNGLAAHPAAGDALTKFRARGGFVVLVSNAPRGGDIVVGMLDRLGVPRTAYDGVVTSGDVSRAILARERPETLAYIGPDKDRVVFAGLKIRETDIAAADIALCTGLFNDEGETPDDYRAQLEACLARNLTMICANPDLIVERGAELLWCAGAIADKYERMGGRVVWTGKPHRVIYDAALDLAGLTLKKPIDLSRVMAIGDAIRTDVAGAAGLGVRSLMIADGIHAKDLFRGQRAIDAEKAQAFFATAEFKPDAAMARLAW